MVYGDSESGCTGLIIFYAKHQKRKTSFRVSHFLLLTFFLLCSISWIGSYFPSSVYRVYWNAGIWISCLLWLVLPVPQSYTTEAFVCIVVLHYMFRDVFLRFSKRILVNWSSFYCVLFQNISAHLVYRLRNGGTQSIEIVIAIPSSFSVTLYDRVTTILNGLIAYDISLE